MMIKLPFIIRENGKKLESVIDTFSSFGQIIYRRKNNFFSFFNPFLIYIYIIFDWKYLLNIPPLIKECSFISTNLLIGLRNVSIIENTSFPFLHENQIPNHLLSLNKSSKFQLENLLIILLTSTKTEIRFDAARQSWINHLSHHKSKIQLCTKKINLDCFEYFECCLNISKRNSAKLIVIGDKVDQQRGIITLPDLMGKTSYLDAQHRQLKIMKYIFKQCKERSSKKCLLENIRWISLIDDDTWINVNRIIHILTFLNWKYPMIVGHILTQQESDKDLLYISGGAGIFMSRPAFDIIAPKIYESCPFCKYNDVTIGACSAISSIQRVHIPLFLAFRPAQLTPTILSNVAAIHYMTPYDMINNTNSSFDST